MTIPADWSITYYSQNGVVQLREVRGVCPHCRNASTFSLQSHVSRPDGSGKVCFFVVVQCNSVNCNKIAYIATSVVGVNSRRSEDEFFIHPSRTVDQPHPAIPKPISEDWIEAQRAMEAAAPKAAAVMCRRVLYGVILDKNCKEHPLHEGLKQLIQGQRLPAIFDDWLPAIKDDGHDAAHPFRALDIDPQNVTETMEYTSELLRTVYIEPDEFQQRKSRTQPMTAKP